MDADAANGQMASTYVEIGTDLAVTAPSPIIGPPRSRVICQDAFQLARSVSLESHAAVAIGERLATDGETINEEIARLRLFSTTAMPRSPISR